MDYGVKFSKFQNFKLQGFFDSDWGFSAEDMKSSSGYFIFGDGCFSWCSKKIRDCCSINSRGRIHCCYNYGQSSFMDKENLMRSWVGDEGNH